MKDWTLRSRSPRLAVTVFALASAFVVSNSPAIAAPAPVERSTVVLIRVSGTVSVLEPGAGTPTTLGDRRRTVRLGTTVQAEGGVVELIAAASGHGDLQTGDFGGGAFKVVRQSSTGRTVLALVDSGGAERECAVASAHAIAARRPETDVGDSLRSKTPSSRRSHLHRANRAARGRVDDVGFEVRGANGASRVSGAAGWTTTDTCKTTEVSSQGGAEVEAVSGPPHGERTFKQLGPGLTESSECSSSPARYCVLLIGENTRVQGGTDAIYGAGLVTVSASHVAELCVRGPSGQRSCSSFPLSPQNGTSTVATLANCLPFEGEGEYDVSWQIEGVPIGETLVYKTQVLPFAFPPQGACETAVGKWLTLGEEEHLSELNAPYKFVDHESVPRTGEAHSIDVELGPTGARGTQLIRGVVYADEGGKPGKLLGETKILRFTQNSPYEPDYTLAFAEPVPIPAGTVWVGLSTGGKPNVAGYSFASVAGARAKNGGPPAVLAPDNPSDPFGEPEQGHGIDERYVTLSLNYVD